MALNKVMLIGNVGKDPDVRTIGSDSKVASFTLATSEKYKDKNGEQHENTEWHNIVCWRSQAEVVERYVHKGMQLYVEGKIQTRSYDGKDGTKKYITEIVASSIQMLGSKSDNQNQGNRYPSAEQAPFKAPEPVAPAAPAGMPETEQDNDDLPF